MGEGMGREREEGGRTVCEIQQLMNYPFIRVVDAFRSEDQRDQSAIPRD